MRGGSHPLVGPGWMRPSAAQQWWTSHWTMLRAAPEEADHRWERWWSWVLMIRDKTVALARFCMSDRGDGRASERGWEWGFITPSTGWTECVQRHSSAPRCGIPLKPWNQNTDVLVLHRMGPEGVAARGPPCWECGGWGSQRVVVCSPHTNTTLGLRRAPYRLSYNTTEELLFSCFLLLFSFFPR